MIKAVVFDFGGVLVRTEDPTGRRSLEKRLGLPDGSIDELVFASEVSNQASTGLVPEEMMWEKLGEQFHLSPEEMVQFRQDFWRGDRLDQDLIRFVAGLKPKYKTAVLSNAWSGARQVFTKTHALDKVFDDILISAEEGVMKPDPAIFERLVSRLGVLPEEVIFVDDYLPNIKAAQAFGLNAIRFQSTRKTIDAINQLLEEDKKE